MSNNKSEVELDFFEPSLAIIITNLDYLLTNLNLNKQDKLNQQLEKILVEFEEIADLDLWDQLANKLEKLESEIVKELLKIKDSGLFNLICAFQISKSLALLLKQNSFIFKGLDSLEQTLKTTNQQDYLDYFKKLVVSKVNEILKENKPIFNNLISSKDEFKKVYQILCDETNFDDLFEGNQLLIEILRTNLDFANQTDLRQLNTLVKIQAYLDFINFWQQTIGLEEN
ncbi:hypothetical protein [Mycoplasma putrefaciens]|uniref:Uncharacterized protein n=1 Tax=Mycoplasma putrefaciens Mput9231 TaxID=1292033 RepID=M9WCZ1_9MOLU|nr:hypothetical protein [Mycoplasma putrefaciens]AGJ90701.1 Hypothetical protein MPUT9231_2770 [Mycoplasma putrefaciens Mput9231]